MVLIIEQWMAIFITHNTRFESSYSSKNNNKDTDLNLLEHFSQIYDDYYFIRIIGRRDC